MVRILSLIAIAAVTAEGVPLPLSGFDIASCDNLLAVPLLLIPMGHESANLTKSDLPVKACLSQREAPPLWAQPFLVSRLKIEHAQAPNAVVDKKRPLQPAWKLRHIYPQSAFCKWWNRNVYGNPLGFCKDCKTKSCNFAASVVPGSPDYQVEMSWPDTLSPGSDGDDVCVCLENLPLGATSITAQWDDSKWFKQIDPPVIVCLLAGMLLMRYCGSLRESPTFHAAFGGVIALILWVVAFTWWILRNMRNTATGVPILGGIFSVSFAVAFASFPSFRSMLNPFQSISVFTSWLSTFLSLKDPFGYELPVGWIILFAFVFFGLIAISYGAKWSMSFFASLPEPEGEVAFTIGSDGRRIDILPPTPWPQWFLGGLIWLVGITIVLRSTYSSVCSLILAGLTFDLPWVLAGIPFGLASQVFVCSWHRQVTPRELRRVISPEAYERQKNDYTTKALQRLREYTRSNPGVLARVGDDRTELRLRRFVDDGNHVRQDFTVWDDNSPSRFACTIL